MKIKYSIHIILLFYFLSLFFLYLSKNQAYAGYNSKYASIVVDVGTGSILYESNANKVLYPASLTKMMTLLMLFEALDKGKIRLNERMYVSNHAASMPPSKVNLPVGGTIRVKDAIYLLVTKSANDVAVVVAERLGGNEKAFARKMTRKAKALGMSRTRFTNASGLHDKRQVSTASDMVKLARYLIFEYPQYYHYFSTKYYTYKGVRYKNHNNLLKKYKGMDGLKTGYIRASGFNLVASVNRDGRRVIAVVFGGKTAKRRDAHMANLLNKSYKKLARMGMLRKVPPKPYPRPSYDNLLVAQTEYQTEYDDDSYNNSYSDIGEGDFDPEHAIKVQEDLITLLSHTKAQKQMALARQAGLKLPEIRWTIQIGAFKTRTQTNRALHLALANLPDGLNNSIPSIYPVRIAEGKWLFQAKLSGYTEQEAKNACSFLKDCFVIKPKENR